MSESSRTDTPPKLIDTDIPPSALFGTIDPLDRGVNNSGHLSPTR